MKITNAKWAEILVTTRKQIADWNALSAKHGCSDTFHCDEHVGPKHLLLITRQRTGSGNMTAQHAVARETESGEVRKTKLNFRKGRLVGFKTWPSDPKAWSKLADKPAAEIVGKLKLVDFMLVTGVTSGGWSTSYRGQVFTAEESQRLEQICRDRQVSMEQAILILREA